MLDLDALARIDDALRDDRFLRDDSFLRDGDLPEISSDIPARPKQVSTAQSTARCPHLAGLQTA